jgi:hypothetical protein
VREVRDGGHRRAVLPPMRRDPARPGGPRRVGVGTAGRRRAGGRRGVAGDGPAQTAPPKKRSIVPWIIGILVVLLLGVAGIAVAGYVFRDEIREFVKSKLEANGRPARRPVVENSNTNSSTNTRAGTNSNSTNANSPDNSNSETKKEPPAFVPPADAVQFTNSRQNLDGDLAEHYVGFSFYYPRTWTKDPKAGIHGATSFAKVDRQFSDSTGDFIQERALFNWYPSKGSYEADQPDFPAGSQR